MEILKSLLRLAVVLAVFAGLEARAQNDVTARNPGTQQKEPGKASLPVSCGLAAQSDFDHAIALFHSSWHAQSIQPFTGLAGKYPNCGMAYWGIAVSILHNPPGGHPMTAKAWKEGRAAVEKALSAGPGSELERDYVGAVEAFYGDAKVHDLPARIVAYQKAMERVYLRHPDDLEAGVFYALALNLTEPSTDRTFFFNRLKAAVILEKAFGRQPGHPGATYYLVHGCSGLDPLD